MHLTQNEKLIKLGKQENLVTQKQITLNKINNINTKSKYGLHQAIFALTLPPTFFQLLSFSFYPNTKKKKIP